MPIKKRNLEDINDRAWALEQWEITKEAQPDRPAPDYIVEWYKHTAGLTLHDRRFGDGSALSTMVDSWGFVIALPHDYNAVAYVQEAKVSGKTLEELIAEDE